MREAPRHVNEWVKPMMSIAARLDELPTYMWVALAILGFVFWWPLGLAVLVYFLWSGRMRCCGIGFGQNNNSTRRDGPARNWTGQPRSSGNRAFDEYRAETLKRLEEEQRAFQEYLERLRMAKDRAEFDQFMAERGARPEPSSKE
jgi:hypothetical protein